MKIAHHLVKAHALILLCVLGVHVGTPQARAANLVLNGSFENGNWDGTQSFVDAGNATLLLFWNNVADRWTPNDNSSWIQDPIRANAGNRMVWLGPPTSATDTFISEPISTPGAGGSLAGNTSYHLSLAYDFFDKNDPQNMMGMDSSIKVYYTRGHYMFMGDPNMPMLLDDATQTTVFTDTGTTDSWLNGASMNWKTASIDFVTPDMSGYDYLRIFIAAPQNSGPTPSMGVLVDNVSLDLAAVPEPSSLLLLSVAAGMALLRRRKS